jgi:hypothetical protein
VSVQLFGAGTVSADEVLQAWAKAYRNVRDDVRYAPTRGTQTKMNDDELESLEAWNPNPLRVHSIAYEGTTSTTGLSNYTHGLVVRTHLENAIQILHFDFFH